MKVKIAIVACVLCLLTSGLDAADSPYPSKPITLLVPYSPGGATDPIVRILAGRAEKALGQPVVVLNKPGGATAIATTALKNSSADGYTIGTVTTAMIIAAYTQSVPYNVAKDFAPIMQFGSFNYGLLVRADSPWRNFKEFMDYVKANPGKIKYATGGIATPQNLMMERLRAKFNIQMKGIHFPGGAEGDFALLGGHLDANIGNSNFGDNVKAGKLRLLAVFSEKRLPDYPDTPTFIESGYEYYAQNFLGFAGPIGVQGPILKKLETTFREAMDSEAFLSGIKHIGMSMVYRDMQQFAEQIRNMNSYYKTVIETSGIAEKKKVD